MMNTTAYLDPCKSYVAIYRAIGSPLTALFGLVGGTFAFLLHFTDSKRTRFNIYACSLIFSHTIILILNSFIDDFLGRGLCYITASHLVPKIDSYSPWSCKLMEYFPNVMYMWSNWTLLVFTLDRFLTVMNPIVFYSTLHKRVALIACIVVGVISLTAHVPILVKYTIFYKSDSGVLNGYKCNIPPNSSISKIFLYNKMFASFLIPTSLIFVLNICIILKLWRLTHMREKLFPANAKKSSSEMSRVVAHLGVSTSFLLVCIPLVLVMLIRLVYTTAPGRVPDKHVLHQLADLSRFVSSVKDISYAADFYIYFIFMPNFRDRSIVWLAHLCWCLECVRNSNPIQKRIENMLDNPTKTYRHLQTDRKPMAVKRASLEQCIKEDESVT